MIFNIICDIIYDMFNSLSTFHACLSSLMQALISIPLLSRRFTGFITPIEIAPFHSSDPTPSARSDLRYVPTLRTYLHYERSYPIYKMFFYSELRGSLSSGVACRQKCQFYHADRREKSRRFHTIAVRNHGAETKSR